MHMASIHINRAQWQRRPWLNGRGWSHGIWDGESSGLHGLQILRTPIAEAAPFSSYAGSDRIFTVVTGNVLDLVIKGSAQAARPFSPIRFAGEAEVCVELPHGPAEVLNIIYSRQSWRELAEGETHDGQTLSILHQVGPAACGADDLGEDETILRYGDEPVAPRPGLIFIRLARLA